MSVSVWFGKGSFNGPPQGDYAFAERWPAHSKGLCPLRKVHSFTVKSYVVVASPIVVLLPYCSPFDIARNVSKVIIDTLNRVIVGRSDTNMLIKSGKRCGPQGEHRYSAATIIFKALSSWVNATFFNSGPYRIFWCVTFVVFFVHDVTSWLKVVVEKVCWKAVNQFPLFGSYPIQHGIY